MEAISFNRSTKVNPSKWKSSQPAKEKDLLFTADEVVTAWHDGRGHEEKVMRKLFESNLNKAFEISENLLSNLERDLSIKFIATHLNPKSPTEFKVLILVDKDIFYSEKMQKAYTVKNAVEDKEEEELFSILFSFYPHSANILKENILSDGYFFEYLPKG